jgi:hypothetical protein
MAARSQQRKRRPRRCACHGRLDEADDWYRTERITEVVTSEIIRRASPPGSQAHHSHSAGQVGWSTVQLREPGGEP